MKGLILSGGKGTEVAGLGSNPKVVRLFVGDNARVEL